MHVCLVCVCLVYVLSVCVLSVRETRGDVRGLTVIRTLEKIKRDAPASPLVPIGSMTAAHRDTWAEVRLDDT